MLALPRLGHPPLSLVLAQQQLQAVLLAVETVVEPVVTVVEVEMVEELSMVAVVLAMLAVVPVLVVPVPLSRLQNCERTRAL
jgi:hypothetical protein